MALETTTADPPLTAAADPEDWKAWLLRISAARRLRDDKVPTWQENVEKRQNAPDSGTSDSKVTVNPDWELTKAKIANLYSQTPEVRLQARRGFEDFSAAIGTFGQELNDTISDA